MENVNFLKPKSIVGKIRLGPNHDGGYVVYDKALYNSTDSLLTYGVGWDTAFEEDFNRRTGKNVLLFDHTMFGPFLIDFRFLCRLFSNYEFGKVFKYLRTVRAWSKKLNKLSKRNIKFVCEGIGKTSEFRLNTLANHLFKYGLTNKNILLKIDIEGGEYEIFMDDEIYDSLKYVSQLLIEFHNIKIKLNEMQKIILKLNETFDLIHIHGNNYGETFTLSNFICPEHLEILLPDVIETTFVKSDKVSCEDYSDIEVTYPVKGLDYPNNYFSKDLSLDFL